MDNNGGEFPMKLSRKGEYACMAMLYLAEKYQQGKIKVTEICAHSKIPRKYLEQILLTLSRGGLVQSERGRYGGHSLAKPPSKITIAEIVRLIDGPLAPVSSVSEYFYQHTPIEREKGLHRFFREIRDMIAEKMENTTLVDLIK